MNKQQFQLQLQSLWLVTIFGAALILNINFAHAAATGQGGIVEGGCMQDIAGFELGCTANDVRVSGIADVTGDGMVNQDDISFRPVCDAMAQNAGADCSADAGVCLDADGNPEPKLCGDKCAYPGDTTSFSATFIFELSAQARYDVGAYFEVRPDILPDGSYNPVQDGALTGACNIITLPEDESLFSRPDGTSGNYVDLDTGCKGGNCPQAEDLCGDINEDNNPIYYDMQASKTKADMITVQCIDSDGDGKLNLPNCTSWRQSGANEVCMDGTQAFPGSPSKCNCDPDFQVPIDVPAANISVTKTARSSEVDEPGRMVTFDIKVTNNSPFADITINSLIDDVYGNITSLGTDTSCSVPQTVSHGASYNCSFMAMVTGQGNTTHHNTVTVTGMDENGNELSAFDDATVDIRNVPFSFTVEKSVSPGWLVEPGGDFSFKVDVTNTSTVDDLTIEDMFDDIYGDLNGIGDCAVPQVLVPGGIYSCTFAVNEIHEPGFSQTDTVTVTASDEEGPSAKQSDTATIEITDDPSTITLVKTVSPTSVNEPGGLVTYTFEINNDAMIDTVTINSLVDDLLGSLDGIGSCTMPQTLLPGTSYSCSMTVEVTGNAGDTVINVGTASGMDDDLNPVSDSDSAAVNINDVPPVASLSKEPSSMAVTYNVTVINDSPAEELSIDSLSDDKFGDITYAHDDVISTTCNKGQTIAVGESYSCSFVANVTTSPHTNSVTAQVSDDEGGAVSPSDSATVTFTSNP